jgi:hypothetical protein
MQTGISTAQMSDDMYTQQLVYTLALANTDSSCNMHDVKIILRRESISMLVCCILYELLPVS